MTKSTRDAILAVSAFADAVRAQYRQNLDLFAKRESAFSDPYEKLTPFAAPALTEAQSYEDETGACFILLAHLDGAKVDFSEMEALTWMANDATVFDTIAKTKQVRSDDRVERVGLLHGERAIARAIFLKALLEGYLRALDADLFKRALSAEKDLARIAAPLAQRSADQFAAALEPELTRFTFQQEIIAFARQAQFPVLPLVIGHKKENWDALNGVAMSAELAKQFREHLARQRPTQG